MGYFLFYLLVVVVVVLCQNFIYVPLKRHFDNVKWFSDTLGVTRKEAMRLMKIQKKNPSEHNMLMLIDRDYYRSSKT